MNTKQLRQKILDLAIHGKLVPQDPNDEPASVLLERIRAEKEKLIKIGKIKRNKNDSTIIRTDDKSHYEKFENGKANCINNEIPFELPSGWSWARLGNIAFYKKGPFGSSITKSMFVPESRAAIKVYEQKNAISKNHSLGTYYISSEKFKDLKGFEVFPNDIIVSCAGTIGETYVMPSSMRKGIINQALMQVKLYNLEMTDFYLLYFDLILKNSAQSDSKGTAIKNIPPFDVLKQYLIPIPPIREQKRIISVIKDLEKLLKDIKQNREDITSLVAIAKSKILSLAIHGKLVPQDPNDEPASVLLERIKKEREKLIKQGKIKPSKEENAIIRSDDNCYYGKLPQGWALVWLESVVEVLDYLRQPINAAERAVRINRKSTELYPYYGATGQVGFIDGYLFDGEYVLLGEDGAPFLEQNTDKAYIINGKTWVNNHAHILKPLINTEYLCYVLNATDFHEYVSGTTRLKLTRTEMNRISVPVPPFAEQLRITVQIKQSIEQLDEIAKNLS
jgi:type I restriction enzyme S subunit